MDRSIIDFQHKNIQQLLIPSGVNLSSSLPNIKSAIAFELTDNSLQINDGFTWNLLGNPIASGTFTPTVTPSGQAHTILTVSPIGIYTKVGNVVDFTVSYDIQDTNTGSNPAIFYDTLTLPILPNNNFTNVDQAEGGTHITFPVVPAPQSGFQGCFLEATIGTKQVKTSYIYKSTGGVTTQVTVQCKYLLNI